MKKKITILFERNIASLPPLLTTIESLKNYELTVISGEANAEIDNLFPFVNFIHFFGKRPYNNFFYMVYFKLKKIFLFRRGVKKYLKAHDPGLIWVASAEAAVQLRRILKGKEYVLNIYELYDRAPRLRKRLKPIAQNAKHVIVPEITRANILRVWFNLKKLPFVVPNKPLLHPRESRISVPQYADILNHDKIIIYQGALGRDRNLDALCQAVSEMGDYRLLLMGKKTEYLDSLLTSYKNIFHIGFVSPPLHLHITSNCYIGVVTYAYYSLNTIFCAPNKIWEYSGFSIPMIANNIPGLNNTVERFGAGFCIDMDDVNAIKHAILTIDKNYPKYQAAADEMFNSVKVDDLIAEIAQEAFSPK